MLMLPHARTAGRLAANAFIASMAGGLVFLHLTGIIGLTIFADMTFDKAFLADMAFVPGDTIKALLCALIVHTVARALPDWPSNRLKGTIMVSRYLERPNALLISKPANLA